MRLTVYRLILIVQMAATIINNRIIQLVIDIRFSWCHQASVPLLSLWVEFPKGGTITITVLQTRTDVQTVGSRFCVLASRYFSVSYFEVLSLGDLLPPFFV